MPELLYPVPFITRVDCPNSFGNSRDVAFSGMISYFSVSAVGYVLDWSV